jgi:hypothetical protein
MEATSTKVIQIAAKEVGLKNILARLRSLSFVMS